MIYRKSDTQRLLVFGHKTTEFMQCIGNEKKSCHCIVNSLWNFLAYCKTIQFQSIQECNLSVFLTHSVYSCIYASAQVIFLPRPPAVVMFSLRFHHFYHDSVAMKNSILLSNSVALSTVFRTRLTRALYLWLLYTLWTVLPSSINKIDCKYSTSLLWEMASASETPT